MKTFTGDYTTGYPKFPSGSKAAIIDTKVDIIYEIEYSLKDDKAIEK